MELIFWIALFIIFYTYLGYGIVLYLLVRVRSLFKGKRSTPEINFPELPTCTILIAAYNEEDFIRAKISNTLELEYPKEKLEIVIVTDGSDDRTPEIIEQYPEIRLMHQSQRYGKIAAMHRGVNEVKTEIIIFTDANTILNKRALLNIARHYSDPKVGAIAGEKRIYVENEADAGAAGEGFYWRYESTLKKWDSELYSVVGAAGELFSIRTNLYEPVANDTILDDFMISMLIAAKGYRIVYEPNAYALEHASENISEELKRKIRIAAGGIQSILRLISLLNIFRYGILSFQYISHRVLRWTIAPCLLLLILPLNILILINRESAMLFTIFLSGQLTLYFMALIGFILEKRQLRLKILFIPYYFCVMNYAILAGFKRYFINKQSVMWEKAKRKTI